MDFIHIFGIDIFQCGPLCNESRSLSSCIFIVIIFGQNTTQKLCNMHSNANFGVCISMTTMETTKENGKDECETLECIFMAFWRKVVLLLKRINKIAATDKIYCIRMGTIFVRRGRMAGAAARRTLTKTAVKFLGKNIIFWLFHYTCSWRRVYVCETCSTCVTTTSQIVPCCCCLWWWCSSETP